MPVGMADAKYLSPPVTKLYNKPYLSEPDVTNKIDNPRWRLFDIRKTIWSKLIVYWLMYSYFCNDIACCDHSHGQKVTSANIQILYRENGIEKTKLIDGHYGMFARKAEANGIGVHVRTIENLADGCKPLNTTTIPTQPWIAVVKRGICDFNVKINNAAKANASAVIIYGKLDGNHVMGGKGNYSVEDVISVFVDDGQSLVEILDKYENVLLSIKVVADVTSTPSPYNANNTSVLFVSLSFIVLIIISLAWLVFYYIQRCRYANAKERLRRRLANAAKKAIAKIPQRSIKTGDKELELDADQCAVCIEPYKTNDVTRILPCKHVFHKSCVDPWLLEKRSCPMCKMDILRAFGMHLNGSQESVPQDQESGVIPSSPALEEVDHLSTSEEQGAVGGVKIVLYQHPSALPHYHTCIDGEMSSGASLDCHTTECHAELTSETPFEEKQLSEQASISRSLSLESVHNSDSECNEVDPLMPGTLVQETMGSKHSSLGSLSSKKSGHSSLHYSLQNLPDSEN
ncbi:hypothetical protein CHS0354_034860 [Potamilus streckersoni]|uniref:RING-type domain-containing protein n=1 Tax=Potamilus streckersoni TaxID=2493646 RepID=A0AAE0WDL0_9BIVA|nr:hypothetical protein CHS0354_034860 [Potamilus streckersoni]